MHGGEIIICYNDRSFGSNPHSTSDFQLLGRRLSFLLPDLMNCLWDSHLVLGNFLSRSLLIYQAMTADLTSSHWCLKSQLAGKALNFPKRKASTSPSQAVLFIFTAWKLCIKSIGWSTKNQVQQTTSQGAPEEKNKTSQPCTRLYGMHAIQKRASKRMHTKTYVQLDRLKPVCTKITIMYLFMSHQHS